MRDLKPEFIYEFLNDGPSQTTIADLLAAFQQDEATRDGPHTYRIPYAYWQNCLDDTLKQEIAGRIDTQIIDETDLQTHIACLGIQMRLYPRQWPLLNAVKARGASEYLSPWSVSAVLEAISIYRAVFDWPTLLSFTQRAMQIFPRAHQDAGIITDCFVLAAYRLMGQDINRGKDGSQALANFTAHIKMALAYIGNDTKNGHFYQSLQAKSEGNIDASIQQLVDAQKADGKVIVFFQRLENFLDVKSIAKTPTPLLQRLLAAPTYNFRHQAGEEETVLLVSLDEEYFEKYCTDFLSSYGHRNIDGLAHLHCINFVPPASVLSALEASSNTRINITCDMQPELAKSENLFRGYAAGARYIFLPLYLERYKNIVITDVDGFFLAPSDKIWNRHPKSTIMLDTKLFAPDVGEGRHNSWTTGFLWELIRAGNFAIRRTEKNMQFAHIVANYLAEQITKCEQHGYELFYTDQIALLLAYKALEQECTFGHSFEVLRQRLRF